MATLKEVGLLLEQVTKLDHPLFKELETDHRLGVQKLLKQRKRALEKEEAEQKRLDQLLRYERALYEQGVKLIAGIDEVGRGPLAGPVIAAAVILPQNCQIKGLNDSKKVSKKKHAELYQMVMREALAIGIGCVDQEMIDQVNIYEATKIAMKKAIEQLSIVPEHLLVDAMTLESDLPQTSIIKGDANSLSIAAASIVAKVTRDRLMTDYAQEFPEYSFEKNAGYGTKEHLLALEKYGICPLHRKSFEPIKSMLNPPSKSTIINRKERNNENRT